ncbi:ciliary microtubule inner protein 7 [Discoglossus pictus]
MPGDITGSWFPGGFHAPTRSSGRADLSLEYRREARPPPPRAFLERMKENPAKHTFSKHDNRNIFPGSGVGKKKLMKGKDCNSLLIWAPLEEELKRQRPLPSSYQVDFWKRDDPRGLAVPQLLVPRFSRVPSAVYPGTTTYRQMLRSHQPRQSFTADSRQDMQQTTIMEISQLLNTRAGSSQRARTAPYQRLTVSDCLTWSRPDPVTQESPPKPDTPTTQ